jgi:hypothetical protein
MIAVLLLSWGCSGPDPDPSRDTASGLPLVVGTGQRPTGETAQPQIVVDAAPDVAAGGQLWVLGFIEHLPITATLDGVLLEGRSSPSYPAAMVLEVPDELPEGPAELLLTSGTTGEVEPRQVMVHAPRVREVAEATGLADRHDPTGAEDGCAQALTGIAWADLDLDGDFDALVGHYGPSSRVLLHDGASPGTLPTFTDVSVAAGFDTVSQVAGLAIADIDNDGDPDVFVGRRGPNQLLRNEFVETGEVRFTDVTAEWGVGGGDQRTMGAVFGDPDNDGDVDFYEINHTWCFPGQSPDPADNRVEDHFWLNEGDHFVQVDGLIPDDRGARSNRFGFVGMWLDHERDGDLDLFVVNDFVPSGGPNTLLRNDGPSPLSFTDLSEGTDFGLHPDPVFKGLNGMGLSVADLNGDGFPDFAVSNIGPNVLLMSEPRGTGRGYANHSELLGTHRPLLPWGVQSVTWGTQMFDHDNDGDIELFYVGGNIRGAELIPHAFFDNDDGTFTDLTWTSGLANPGHGKASALVDLDHDGFLDLAVTNWAGELEVHHNQGALLFPDHHWVAIDLQGDGVNTHRDAMGAIVELTAGGRTQTCFRSPRPSLSGGGDPACRFGLGTVDTIDEVVITWPDGHVTSIAPPAVDERVRVVDPRAR